MALTGSIGRSKRSFRAPCAQAPLIPGRELDPGGQVSSATSQTL